MKKIECYLREEDADHVLNALSDLGVNGVTLCPVQGFGRQRGGLGGHLLPKTEKVTVTGKKFKRSLGTVHRPISE